MKLLDCIVGLFVEQQRKKTQNFALMSARWPRDLKTAKGCSKKGAVRGVGILQSI